MDPFWVLPQAENELENEAWQWQDLSGLPHYDMHTEPQPISWADWALLSNSPADYLGDLMAMSGVVEENPLVSSAGLGGLPPANYPIYPMSFYPPPDYYWWHQPGQLADNHGYACPSQLFLPTPPSTAVSEQWPDRFLLDMGSASSQLVGEVAEGSSAEINGQGYLRAELWE